MGQMFVAPFILPGNKFLIDDAVKVPFAKVLQGLLHFRLQSAHQIPVFPSEVDLVRENDLPEGAEHLKQSGTAEKSGIYRHDRPCFRADLKC